MPPRYVMCRYPACSTVESITGSARTTGNLRVPVCGTYLLYGVHRSVPELVGFWKRKARHFSRFFSEMMCSKRVRLSVATSAFSTRGDQFSWLSVCLTIQTSRVRFLALAQIPLRSDDYCVTESHKKTVLHSVGVTRDNFLPRQQSDH